MLGNLSSLGCKAPKKTCRLIMDVGTQHHILTFFSLFPFNIMSKALAVLGPLADHVPLFFPQKCFTTL